MARVSTYTTTSPTPQLNGTCMICACSSLPSRTCNRCTSPIRLRPASSRPRRISHQRFGRWGPPARSGDVDGPIDRRQPERTRPRPVERRGDFGLGPIQSDDLAGRCPVLYENILALHAESIRATSCFANSLRRTAIHGAGQVRAGGILDFKESTTVNAVVTARGPSA